MRPPLEGIRVLDLGQVWAGPQLGLYLADFGAEVILVETGVRTAMQASTLRLTTITPEGTYQQITDPADPRSYNGLGRNRRCISLNLETPDGHALFLRLVAISDIVFDNFSPRAVRKLEIDYETLRHVNPGVIVASLSAVGQHGPWSDLLTYGPSLTALSGIKSQLGYPEDGKIQEDLSDLDPIAATYALIPILAALRARRRTGRGQFIDIAQAESGIAALAEAVMEYTMNGRVMTPQGNRHRTMAPHGIFPAAGADRWVSISIDGDAAWRAFCLVLGHAEAAGDARFVDMHARLQNVDALEAEVRTWTTGFDAEELAAALQGSGVAAYPVLDAIGVFGDEQLTHRRQGRFAVETDGITSDQVFSGMPWLMSEGRPVLRRPVGPTGADNEYVFGELLGMAADEMAAATASGVIA